MPKLGCVQARKSPKKLVTLNLINASRTVKVTLYFGHGLVKLGIFLVALKLEYYVTTEL